MTDKLKGDDLKEMVERSLSRSLGAPGSVIARERLRNLEAYLAKPEGAWAPPEVEDRSDFVATDVADTVEWMLPSLLRIFASSRKAIEVTARHPKFEEQANLVQEVMRHIFWDKCNGFQVLHDFLKDGLLQKVGFVRVRWEDREIDITEHYQQLTEAQLAMVASDEDVEVVEQQESVIQVSDGVNPPVPVKVYDVTLKRKSPEGCCVLDAVPPEEMRVSSSTVYTNREPHFIAQVTRRPRAELEAEGFDAEDTASGEGYSEEETARKVLDTNQVGADDDADRGGEMVRFVDAYPMNGNERKHVIIVGEDMQEDEPADDHPFVWWCPNPLPHVFFGQCPADQALSPQVLHTNLIRAIEDNVYLGVNSRTEVPDAAMGKDTINDLLSSRPGGIVRTKAPGMLNPLVQPDLTQSAWNTVEWAEQWLEKRTGFSRMSKGLSPDTLNTETATGVLELTERADMRTELIARQAANALEWMLTKVMKCMSQYQEIQQSVRINGQWVDYDPREWANNFTVRVNVGMGAGNRDRRANAFQTLSNPQALMVGAGVLPREASVALMRDWAASMGEDTPEKYFPDALPPTPPPPDPKLQVEQMKQQGAMQAKQADVQAEQQKTQMEVQAQAQIAQNEQEAQARQETLSQQLEARMKQMQAQMDAQMQARDLAAQARENELNRQLEVWKTQFQAHAQQRAAVQQRQHDHIQGRLSADDQRGMNDDASNAD